MTHMTTTRHIPGVRHVPKMDQPTGLFGGTCSCGWKSNGLETEASALKSAKKHATALSATVSVAGVAPGTWGVDPESDCRELRKNESWGLYPAGYHAANCPIDHEGRFLASNEQPNTEGVE